jgi:hypothetical protein
VSLVIVPSLIVSGDREVPPSSERVRRRIDADRPVPPGSGRERGRGSACTVVTDRWGPPVRRRGRARPDWAGLGLMGCFRFFFFHGIFNAFSFYFLYGF